MDANQHHAAKRLFNEVSLLPRSQQVGRLEALTADVELIDYVGT